MKTYAVAYQVVGWYNTVKPEHRNSRTLSDGAIFSNPRHALEYARSKMTGWSIKRWENPTPDAVDHLIRDGSWRPSCA